MTEITIRSYPNNSRTEQLQRVVVRKHWRAISKLDLPQLGLILDSGPKTHRVLTLKFGRDGELHDLYTQRWAKDLCGPVSDQLFAALRSAAKIRDDFDDRISAIRRDQEREIGQILEPLRSEIVIP